MGVKKQVVRQLHPLRDLIVAVVGVVAIGASAYALYASANGRAQDDFVVLYEERDELLVTVEALRSANSALRERVAIPAREIGRASCRESV